MLCMYTYINTYIFMYVYILYTYVFMYMYQLSIYRWITYDVIVLFYIQEGHTNLMNAAFEGHVGVVKYLMEGGKASISETDNVR
jgi:hypothetical protein